MKTEISRDSYQPKKRYSGVYQQQGRMLTDADWNELVEILKERLNEALKDIVGSKEKDGSIGGTPRHRALKIIQKDLKENPGAKPEIVPGHIYIDGIAAEIPGYEHEHLTLDAQPDFPSPPNPIDDYILYADVWERTVTYLMDESLRDKGLHGADTCTRKQTMAQIKWCTFVEGSSDNIDPEQSDKNPSKGNVRLSVSLPENNAHPDPCDPCANQVKVDSKVGNYLFRVEIHDVKLDVNNDPEEITLKWSSENGAEQYALKNAAGDDVGPPAEFISGRWVYEFFNETSEKQLGVHLKHSSWDPTEDSSWNPTREVLKEVYEVPENEPNSYVRRWDGYCTLSWSSSGWTPDKGIDRGNNLKENGRIQDSIGGKIFTLGELLLELQLFTTVSGEPVTSDPLDESTDESTGELLPDLIINQTKIICKSSAKKKADAIKNHLGSTGVDAEVTTVLKGVPPSETGDINDNSLKINGEKIEITGANNVQTQADALVIAIETKHSNGAITVSASKTPEGAILLTEKDGGDIKVVVDTIETSNRCGFSKDMTTAIGNIITLTSPSNKSITISGKNPEYAGFVAGTTSAVQFVAGDYWLGEVREAEHKLGDVIIEDEVPQGIKHHYLTLGTVVKGELQDNPAADRKYAFPPLTEMTRMFHVGGDGQEAMPEHELPHPIQVGVGNGEWPVKGAKVRFEIVKYSSKKAFNFGSLKPPTPAVVITDENGIAKCEWTLGNTGNQRVKVTLLDPDAPSDNISLKHSPIYFNANLSTADQIAYTPGCQEEHITVHSLLTAADEDENVTWPKLDKHEHSTVATVLNTLLCELKATHLPIEKNALLCETLNQADINTVQDALNTLCKMDRGCAVTVGDGGKYPTIEKAFASDQLKKETQIRICLLPRTGEGSHIIENLDVSGKESISITGHRAIILLRGNLSLEAVNIALSGIHFSVIDKVSKEGKGTGSITLNGGNVVVEHCHFFRIFYDEDEVAKWHPLVTVGKLTNLKWVENSMTAFRNDKSIASAAIPKKDEIPPASLNAYHALKALFEKNPYDDPEDFYDETTVVARKISKLGTAIHKKWHDNRPVTLIKKLQIEPVRISRPVTGIRRIVVTPGRGGIEPIAGRVTPRSLPGLTATLDRSYVMSEISPRGEVEKFFNLLKSAEATNEATNVVAITEALHTVAVLVYTFDYALALESNDVWGWISNNDFSGYVALHNKQNDDASPLFWASTASQNRQNNKNAWTDKYSASMLSPKRQLSLQGNEFTAVHSMVPNNTLGDIEQILDSGEIPEITIQAYDSLTVRDNIFYDGNNSFISKFLNISGNQFTNSVRKSVVAYTLGFSGVFLGGQAFEPTAIIEQILHQKEQAANLLKIV